MITRRFLGIGGNVINGTAVFNNSKVAVVDFGMTFPRKPYVTLTMNDTGIAPPCKFAATTSGLTIKFPTPWTGEVDWEAKER